MRFDNEMKSISKALLNRALGAENEKSVRRLSLYIPESLMPAVVFLRANMGVAFQAALRRAAVECIRENLYMFAQDDGEEVVGDGRD